MSTFDSVSDLTDEPAAKADLKADAKSLSKPGEPLGRAGQSENQRCVIGLMNPKNVGNVGDVVRAAGCFAVNQVVYTGDRFDRARQFADATTKHMPGVQLARVESLLAACPAGYTRVAVELVLGAMPLTTYQHPVRAVYLFGPEDASLDQATVDQCDEVVYIPAAACLNLAASVNVLLYDRSVKQGLFTPGDELLLSSRDNRNRLRVTTA